MVSQTRQEKNLNPLDKHAPEEVEKTEDRSEIFEQAKSPSGTILPVCSPTSTTQQPLRPSTSPRSSYGLRPTTPAHPDGC